MKKFIVAILAVMLSLTAAFGFTACDETKTVTVGYTNYAPMNYTDESGELIGFDTELATKMFEELGYEVRFKLIDWDNKYSELNGGTIDCIWNGFTYNTADSDGIQRSDKVDFTYYYMNNAQCIVCGPNAPAVNDFSQFDGKTVSFENGSAGETFVTDIEANLNAKGVGSQMDALMNVKMGTADYAVIDVLLAQSIVGKGDYSTLSVNTGIEIPDEFYAVGFKKGSELTAKINELFVNYAENGYLAQLAEKYGLSNSVITDFSNQIAA